MNEKTFLKRFYVLTSLFITIYNITCKGDDVYINLTTLMFIVSNLLSVSNLKMDSSNILNKTISLINAWLFPLCCAFEVWNSMTKSITVSGNNLVKTLYVLIVIYVAFSCYYIVLHQINDKELEETITKFMNQFLDILEPLTKNDKIVSSLESIDLKDSNSFINILSVLENFLQKGGSSK